MHEGATCTWGHACTWGQACSTSARSLTTPANGTLVAPRRLASRLTDGKHNQQWAPRGTPSNSCSHVPHSLDCTPRPWPSAVPDTATKVVCAAANNNHKAEGLRLQHQAPKLQQHTGAAPTHTYSTNLSSALPSFPLPNSILYLGIPCALVKLME